MTQLPSNLTPAVLQILELDPAAYTRLAVRGSGNAAAQTLLGKLSPADVFVAGSAKSSADAQAVLAGLWLWHDWLDESHVISQSLTSATGSFWHAIMHRREGDFSNSKYWYARIGTHPALASLANSAASIVNSSPAEKSILRIVASGWNPAAFVDLVEAVEDHPNDPRHKLAVQLQQLEWRTLFDQCAR